MEDEKTAELKNKIAELKQRLNQLYAQYFSDAREGKVFETEFSLYLKASEVARREKNNAVIEVIDDGGGIDPEIEINNDIHSDYHHHLSLLSPFHPEWSDSCLFNLFSKYFYNGDT